MRPSIHSDLLYILYHPLSLSLGQFNAISSWSIPLINIPTDTN